MIKRLRHAALAIVLALPMAACAQEEQSLEDLAHFPRSTLEITAGPSTHRIQVWVADTPARQQQGLMFVRDLAADAGMLFTHCCTGIWMRNTYIPLDIVFVGVDGRIEKIAENARPFDETTIPAPAPAAAVVELRGGEASHLKLKVGDRVQWSAPKAP